MYSDEGHAYTSNHAHSQKTLSPREEDFYFAKRPSRRHRHQRIRPKSETRSRSSSSKDGKIYKAWGKYKPSNTASDNDGNSHCWWMPPPPFAASSGESISYTIFYIISFHCQFILIQFIC